MKSLRALLTLTVLVSGLVYAGPAAGAIDTSATAAQIAAAMARDPSVVTGASFLALPPSGTPNAVSDVSLGGFPTDGASYGILTNGDANLADDANTSTSSGPSDGGGNVRGNSDFDVTVLQLDLSVPVGANCLSFKFRFLSDEFPEYVESGYNDAFIAELDSSTWSTSGSTISAPGNFAFDPGSNVISINAAGATSMSAGEAAGTTYDGATPLLGASTPITSGAHALYLSIFDQADHVLDSAVFLDDLFVGHADEGACVPGATTVSTSKTADSDTTEAGSSNGYTITVENTSSSQVTLDSITDTLPAGFSYTSGSTTGATTDEPTVEGQTLTWAGPFVVPGSGSISLHFAVTVSETPGDYANEAGGTSEDAAVTPTGPTATVTVTAPPAGADVGLTIDGPTVGSTGDSLTYVLQATNHGPDTASDVTVTYALPGSATLVSAESSQGSCAGTTTVVCDIGTLGAGESASVTIRIRTSRPGSLTSEASVGSSSGDSNGTNDGATSTTTVAEPIPVPTPPAPGDRDGDGVVDDDDNCPTVSNPSQTDVNKNGVGDACDPPPDPVPGESANLQLLEGTILVKLPGTDEFVELGPGVQIPIGSIINAIGGKVQITTARTGGGGSQSAVFYGGTFKLLQDEGGTVVPARGASAARPGVRTRLITIIRLTGGDFSVCREGRAGRISELEARRRPIRRVWGSGKGIYRTGGTYSSAEVRGTVWLVVDRCDGTYTYVARGTVVVRDFRKHKTIVLKAGQSYLAKAPPGSFH